MTELLSIILEVTAGRHEVGIICHELIECFVSSIPDDLEVGNVFRLSDRTDGSAERDVVRFVSIEIPALLEVGEEPLHIGHVLN